jgi:hypothetical protein
MAAAMFRAATALARAGIRSQDAGATDLEVRQRPLRQLYAGDLTERQLAEIGRSWEEAG